MDSFEKQALKQEARRRLRAQRHRVGQLRVRVVTIGLIGFVLLWGVIFAQMATGHDPVLGTKSPVVAASPVSRKHRAASTEPPVEAAAAAELEAAETEAIEVEPAPVTTSQS